jgi:hypothetical protein
MPLKYKSPCPACFAQTGFSIVLEELPDGTYQCPKYPEHKFKRDGQGFLAPIGKKKEEE